MSSGRVTVARFVLAPVRRLLRMQSSTQTCHIALDIVDVDLLPEVSKQKHSYPAHVMASGVRGADLAQRTSRAFEEYSAFTCERECADGASEPKPLGRFKDSPEKRCARHSQRLRQMHEPRDLARLGT